VSSFLFGSFLCLRWFAAFSSPRTLLIVFSQIAHFCFFAWVFFLVLFSQLTENGAPLFVFALNSKAPKNSDSMCFPLFLASQVSFLHLALMCDGDRLFVTAEVPTFFPPVGCLPFFSIFSLFLLFRAAAPCICLSLRLWQRPTGSLSLSDLFFSS